MNEGPGAVRELSVGPTVVALPSRSARYNRDGRFRPNGAKGDSPGQRPGKIGGKKSSPERAQSSRPFRAGVSGICYPGLRPGLSYSAPLERMHSCRPLLPYSRGPTIIAIATALVFYGCGVASSSTRRKPIQTLLPHVPSSPPSLSRPHQPARVDAARVDRQCRRSETAE